MSKLEFNGKPTPLIKLKQQSYNELRAYMTQLAKQANARIREVEKADLRNYVPTYTRKYNTMLEGNTIPNIGTKGGRKFNTKFGSYENTIERIQAIERFLQNPFTTVEKSEKYLENLMEQWNLYDKDLLKKMYDVYRDLGYDDFKNDSDVILQTFSEMSNKGVDLDLLRDFFTSNTFKDQKQEVNTLVDLWESTKVYASLGRMNPNQAVITAMKSREKRGI